MTFQVQRDNTLKEKRLPLGVLVLSQRQGAGDLSSSMMDIILYLAGVVLGVDGKCLASGSSRSQGKSMAHLLDWSERVLERWDGGDNGDDRDGGR